MGKRGTFFCESRFLVFLVVSGGSGVEVGGLDAAASMTQVEDSHSRRNMSSGNSIGDAMGEVGDAPPPRFSVAAFTEAMPPDEAWTGGSNRVVGGGGIDGSIVGWLEQVGLVSKFPCWV